jgi:putative sigma-54 modulation protein
MGKLDKYLDRLHEIEVELYTEKTREADHHNHVEATAHVTGRTMRVLSEHSDMYAAIDDAVDKLYRQLNRRKERLKAHHNGRIPVLPESVDDTSLDSVTEEDLGDENEVPVVHVERLDMKPQFEEEAIEQMDALGRSFFVFLNARNEQVNVVYRRGDGSYGLIEPLTR